MWFSIQVQTFPEWLQSQLDGRGWSKAEFSANSGIDAGTVSNLLNEVRKPGPDICKKIAKAFGMPQREVFKRAGLLDEKDPYDRVPDEKEVVPSLWELLKLFGQLPEERQEEELAMLRLKVERVKARKAGGRAAAKNAP